MTVVTDMLIACGYCHIWGEKKACGSEIGGYNLQQRPLADKNNTIYLLIWLKPQPVLHGRRSLT